MKPELYQKFAAYNVWMNDKVYGAAAQMSDLQRRADRGAFFGSIHATLNHILFGDRVWLSRFTGNAPDVQVHEEFEALQSARKSAEQDVIAFCDGLTPDWLEADIAWTSGADGIERVRPAWLLVSHMFNHQTHHRGQVSTMLKQAGKDIGTTDLPWMESGDSLG